MLLVTFGKVDGDKVIAGPNLPGFKSVNVFGDSIMGRVPGQEADTIIASRTENGEWRVHGSDQTYQRVSIMLVD